MNFNLLVIEKKTIKYTVNICLVKQMHRGKQTEIVM